MRLSGRKYSQTARHWTRPHRVVLATLISINVAAFVAQLAFETFSPGFVRDYLAISYAGIYDAYSWQFISAMFLHTGAWHFIGNIFLLYVLGRDLETILGQRHFLYLYLAGAIGGELGHLFLMPRDSVLYGATGGVAAIICAYAIVLPELELTSTRWFLFRPKAKHVAAGAITLGLVLLCIDRTPRVAHSALLGGCLAGWLYAWILGFGGPSVWQRFLRRRRERAERFEQMSIEELMRLEIDPLLEKISQRGLRGLTRREHRALLRAREKIVRTPGE